MWRTCGEELLDSCGCCLATTSIHVFIIVEAAMLIPTDPPPLDSVNFIRRGSYEGFPGGAGGKESACYCRRCEMYVWTQGQEDTLEEEMASHSSILAWKIPWTEGPGRLQFMGSRRVRHNGVLMGGQLWACSPREFWIKTIQVPSWGWLPNW